MATTRQWAITELSIRGLIARANQGCSEAERLEIIAEIQRRQQVIKETRQAEADNRRAKIHERVALRLAGELSNKERVRAENSALYDDAREEAFASIELPTGLNARETIRAFKSAVAAETKRIYTQTRNTETAEVKAQRRARKFKNLDEKRWRKKHEDRQLRKEHREEYRRQLTPVRGWRVLYSDTLRKDRQEGTVTTLAFRHSTNSWLVCIKPYQGDPLWRALVAVEPIEKVKEWHRLLAPHLEYERLARLAHSLEFYQVKRAECDAKIAELTPIIEAFKASGEIERWERRKEDAKKAADAKFGL